MYTAHKAFLSCTVSVRSDSRAAIGAKAAGEGMEVDPGMRVEIKPGFRPSGEELDWAQGGKEKEVVV